MTIVTDSNKILVDSVLKIQQEYSASIDSIRDVATRVEEMQGEQYAQLDSIQSQIQAIAENGVGYNDVVSHITFPLIIALFAFAFTYLFSVITRINDKYNSEHISKMFKKSWSYRCYMWGSGVSVGYLVLMGLLSLLLKDTAFLTFKGIMNWISLVVAGSYAGIILWFVNTCLRYDDPLKMLGLIIECYEKDKKKNSSLNERTERLIGLCRYAIRERNADLKAKILNQVDELGKAERENKKSSVQFYTMRFYESIVDTFILTQQDSESERDLLWHWSRMFRHDQLPLTAVIYRMLGKMVESVRRGRISLYDVYMEHCKLRFEYINKVPEVSFFRGENIEEQIKVDNESLATWRELRNVHFLAASYLFSIGHFEATRALRKGIGNSNHSFFPVTAPQILKEFANIKEKQDIDTGSFYRVSMSIDKVIGHKYDRDILEKFVALMLLLAEESEEDESYIVNDQMRKILDDCKDKIISFGNLWKKHPDIVNLFPVIQERKIEEQVKKGMAKLTNGELPGEKNIRGNKKKLQPQTFFDLQLTAKDEEPVKELFDVVLYSNRGNITDGLNGDYTEDKREKVALGSYTFLTSKQTVLNANIWRHPSVVNDMMQVFRSRFFYILYEALSQMTIKDVCVRWNDFEKPFLKYVGDKGKQFVILDTDSHLDGLLKMDDLPEGEKWSLHRHYKGAYYYNAGFGTMYNLRDVPLAESYDHTVMVARFSDLPVIVPETDDIRPEVTISDEPNREIGWAAVRITAEPHLVAKYSKNAEVLRVRFKK